MLSRVADFYARIGEKDRSLKVLQRLAQEGSGGDAGHLVDLGDRYFQDGNAPLAVQTWKRILTAVQPRAKALAALGDVYLEHDMTGDALAAYKEAVALEPSNLAYAKALAAAYERTRAYREAEALYEADRSPREGEGRQDARARVPHAHRDALGPAAHPRAGAARACDASSARRLPTPRPAARSPRR